MDAAPDLALVAQALGDPTRIRMLSLLMTGRAATAKELAYGAGVTPATATAHLDRLTRTALITVRVQGRHKYFRLASPDVAHCVESLMVIAAPPASVPRVPDPLRHARYCYDHLAGRLGTALADAMVRRRVLRETRESFELTPRGQRWLEALGLNSCDLHPHRRKLTSRCLDWSERRDHVGGALGAALAAFFVARRWITRRAGTREVQVTALGEKLFARHFGIDSAALSAPNPNPRAPDPIRSGHGALRTAPGFTSFPPA